jgi:hypothetical protein
MILTRGAQVQWMIGAYLPIRLRLSPFRPQRIIDTYTLCISAISHTSITVEDIALSP